MRLTSILAVLLTACATSAKLNDLSLGMERSQVIQVMGQPDSTAARNGTEVLKYKLYSGSYPSDYCVTLDQGKLVSYGKNCSDFYRY